MEIVESKLLELDDLSNGDHFADDSIVLKQPMKHSIVTSIPTEMFIVHDILSLDKVTYRLFLKIIRVFQTTSWLIASHILRIKI